MAVKSCHGLCGNIDHIIGGALIPVVSTRGITSMPGSCFIARLSILVRGNYRPRTPPFMCRIAALLLPSKLKSFKGFPAPCSTIWSSDFFKIRGHSWFTNLDGDSSFCDAESVRDCNLMDALLF
ncbi:hypothetical protein AAC387_Pa11g0641 [Persea americana]